MSLMNARILWLGWIGLVVVVLLAAGLFARQQGIRKELAALEHKRKGLEAEHRKVENESKKDLERYVKVFKRFPWLLEGGGGTAFLARLSDVTAEQVLKILGVGPLEQKRIGQIERVGRKVKLTGSFSDVLGVVEKVERNRGIMEGLRVEQVDQRGETNALEKLEAEFSLVTVELSAALRQRMRSLLPSLPEPNAKEAKPSPALPAPNTEQHSEIAALRDPFLQLGALRARLELEKENGAKPPFPEVRLSGIVNLPNRKMAIINNRMVGEGDHIEGVLVERVTDSEVVLRSEFEGKRIYLPAFTSSKPAN